MIEKVENIVILGTSHVSQESIDRIKTTVDEENPEVICLELDINRLKGLLNPRKMKFKDYIALIKKIGLGGFLFYIIAGSFQKKIAKKLNMKPGIDMLTAYKISRERKIPSALIDIDIAHTLKKISKIPMRKKFSLLFKLLLSGRKEEHQELLNFDLKTIPKDDVILKLLELIKKEAPIIYRILIEDRNMYMVNGLMKLRDKHEGTIIAVVGAAHVQGMAELLKEKIEFQKLHTVNVEYNIYLNGEQV